MQHVPEGAVFPSDAPRKFDRDGWQPEDVLMLELVAVADVAEMFGVATRTAKRYTVRDDFPEPAGRLAGSRVWRRRDVERWGAKHLERTKVDGQTKLTLRVGSPPADRRRKAR